MGPVTYQSDIRPSGKVEKKKKQYLKGGGGNRIR
jgi:hypothetical protein